MRALLQRLRRDEGGAAIVELGLAAPILAMLVIGIVDLSNAFSRKLTLEQAAQRGIEKIMQTTDDDTVDIAVVNEIASSASIPVEQVAMTTKLFCTGRTTGVVTEKAFTDDCNATTEWESRYIEITARDEFTPMFPITFGANAQGRYPMRVKVGMRTQ
jgi:Flp pilus assembly protein TadG